MTAETGFFMDWDGNARRMDAPGEVSRCRIDPA